MDTTKNQTAAKAIIIAVGAAVCGLIVCRWCWPFVSRDLPGLLYAYHTSPQFRSSFWEDIPFVAWVAFAGAIAAAGTLAVLLRRLR